MTVHRINAANFGPNPECVPYVKFYKSLVETFETFDKVREMSLFMNGMNFLVVALLCLLLSTE